MRIYFRKIWRSIALSFPILYIFLSKRHILYVVGGIFLFFCILDILRLHIKEWNNIFLKVFSCILREKEKKSLSSTTIFLGVIFVSFALFPKPISILVISICVIGDIFSSIIGTKYGKIKILANRTLEGTISFFISAFLTALVFNNFLHLKFNIIVLASVFSSLVELISPLILIDDNISVPLLTGGVVWLLR